MRPKFISKNALNRYLLYQAIQDIADEPPNDWVTSREIYQELLSEFSRNTIQRILRILTETNYLERKGHGSSTQYLITKELPDPIEERNQLKAKVVSHISPNGSTSDELARATKLSLKIVLQLLRELRYDRRVERLHLWPVRKIPHKTKKHTHIIKYYEADGHIVDTTVPGGVYISPEPRHVKLGKPRGFDPEIIEDRVIEILRQGELSLTKLKRMVQESGYRYPDITNVIDIMAEGGRVTLTEKREPHVKRPITMVSLTEKGNKAKKLGELYGPRTARANPPGD